MILYLQPFQILWKKSGEKFMVAIFKSSLQNLSLPTSLKVEPLAKPKTGLKVFVNTTKPKTKVLAVLGQKLETKVSTFKPKPWLRPFVNTGPEGYTKTYFFRIPELNCFCIDRSCSTYFLYCWICTCTVLICISYF